MSELQVTLTLVIFGGVILVIALDLMDMMLAALLGVSLFLVFGILDNSDMVEVFNTAGNPLALLFGGMVVARVLAGTGMFERLGAVYLQATGGSGKRYLLLLVGVLALVCAFLPNATTVILLAPMIIRVAQALKVDFVGPMVLAAIVSNSAGLLTLVGDPATFLVGSSIGMSFGQYLQKVSLAGLLSVLVIVPALRWLLPDIWNARVALPPAPPPPPVERPGFVVFALAVLALMVTLFVIGGYLPKPIGPTAVAIIAATLALVVIYSARAEPLDAVLRDVDWKTLVFLASIFCLVQGFAKLGLLQALALKLHGWFGAEYTLVALLLLAGIGLLSSVIANIPVVAAALVMTKGYLVAVEAVPETALAIGFTDWPGATLPIFIAMMFGATLGGNATLIGASANVVSAGICASHGQRVSFGRFMRYGVPITAAQLIIAALYVAAMTWIAAG
jgi:Na+/H+ antiporter NhaD/arsenite permease-like protein